MFVFDWGEPPGGARGAAVSGRVPRVARSLRAGALVRHARDRDVGRPGAAAAPRGWIGRLRPSWTRRLRPCARSSHTVTRPRWPSWPRRRIPSVSTRSSYQRLREIRAGGRLSGRVAAAHARAVPRGHRGQWGTGVHAAGLGPSVVRPARRRRSGGGASSASVHAVSRRAQLETIFALDVRNVFRSSRFRRSSSTTATTSSSASVTAATSPSTSPARASRRDSADHWPRLEPDLVGRSRSSSPDRALAVTDADRVLATVLFVDVVGLDGCALTSAIGAGRGARDASSRPSQRACITTTGAPRALRATASWRLSTAPPGRFAARHIRDEVRRSGLEVRSGLHAGEVTRRT